MDNLDIQIVDSLTVNLNQEEYSTEGQVLNGIYVYVEDEQLLFEAALTQDSINLYTRETPDIISFDTKGIMDGISKLESLIEKTSKEATLIAKVAELKEALNSIDFTAIEQAIQGVEDVTAKEATLIQGVSDVIKAVENIDFTDLENSIAEVKNAVANIDFSALAKESTLTQGISSVENKVEEVGNKIDNIKLPEIDTSEFAKEATLEEVKSSIEGISIPLTAISGLALELEGGKKNIANALKARGVESSANTDTLTDMAAKVYEVKNPVAFTVPAETSNEWADVMFNTMMKSQGYDKMYAEVVKTYCGEGGTYVGCLMSVLYKYNNTTIELIGADAYYIYEENKFYKTDSSKNLVQIINGVETQLGTKKHLWDDTNAANIRTVFYLYLPDSSADGKREKIHRSEFDYCYNAIIPNIESKHNAPFAHFHIANASDCKITRHNDTSDGCFYFYTNVKVLDGFKGGSNEVMYFNASDVEHIYNSAVLVYSRIKNIEFPNLIEVCCDQNVNSTIASNCNNIEELSFPKLQKIDIQMAYTFSNIVKNAPNLTTLKFPVLRECVVNSGGGGIAVSTPKLKSVEFPLLEVVDMKLGGNGLIATEAKELKSLYLPSLKSAKGSRATLGSPFSSNTGTELESLTYIYAGCIGDRTQEVQLSFTTQQKHEIDVEIGDNARQQITIRNILLKADTIVPHIFDKLADNRFEDDGVTPAPAIKITINATNLAKLTDAQKAIATDKNYILA